MVRLTREQSQAQTRELLLDAGYSKGSLFLALLARASEQMVAGLEPTLLPVTSARELRDRFRALEVRPDRPRTYRDAAKV